MNKYKLKVRPLVVLLTALMVASFFVMMPAMATDDSHWTHDDGSGSDYDGGPDWHTHDDDDLKYHTHDGSTWHAHEDDDVGHDHDKYDSDYKRDSDYRKYTDYSDDYESHKYDADKCEKDPDTEIPEFPTIAIPVLSIIGLMFIMGRKRTE